VALSSPAATHHLGTWRWLVVVSSAKQKQQLHHQQLTNGITIVKTFKFPEWKNSPHTSTFSKAVFTYIYYFDHF
jgi:hypothetical protein